jgi:hypothetical protein
MKHSPVDFVLRPGTNGWEFWKTPTNSVPAPESDFSSKSLGGARHLMMAVPTRSLLAVPVWISPQGDPTELAELELLSRHLLKKNAEVYGIPILEKDGRSLVLALSSIDDDRAHDYYSKAATFEFPARLWDPDAEDVIVWREWGEICFAFYRDKKCVYFACTGEISIGAPLCGIITRTAMRLRSEGVTLRMPARLRLLGDFSFEDRTELRDTLQADLEHSPVPPPPFLPGTYTNPAPPSAKVEMEKRTRWQKFLFFAFGGIALYTLILLFVSGDLLVRRIQLSRLASELHSIEGSASGAHKLVTEWKEFRAAVDPASFAIDQLAAVAAEIPSEQVRLTQYSFDSGRFTIAGEAADVAQAYDYFERIKKAPLLQDYDWTSRQPQLVGRNKVRFEMEGLRPDAKTSEE